MCRQQTRPKAKERHGGTTGTCLLMDAQSIRLQVEKNLQTSMKKQ